MVEKFSTRWCVDLALASRDSFQASLAARLRHVDRILEENDRVVVSKGDRTAAAAHRRIGNGFRGGYVPNPIEIAGLGDVPVLAELAGQVAPCGAKRQDRCAG